MTPLWRRPDSSPSETMSVVAHEGAWRRSEARIPLVEADRDDGAGSEP
jgi:hypothetical protein